MLMTPELLDDLISVRKTPISTRTRWANKPGHKQRSFSFNTQDGRSFEVYIRLNITGLMEDDFSVGLLYMDKSGESILLRRYNGCSHVHTNKIEGNVIKYQYHIHIARPEYYAINDICGFAEVTSRYRNYDGALECLIEDCNILWLADPQPEQTLFNGAD